MDFNCLIRRNVSDNNNCIFYEGCVRAEGFISCFVELFGRNPLIKKKQQRSLCSREARIG